MQAAVFLHFYSKCKFIAYATNPVTELLSAPVFLRYVDDYN